MHVYKLHGFQGSVTEKSNVWPLHSDGLLGLPPISLQDLWITQSNQGPFFSQIAQSALGKVPVIPIVIQNTT